MNRAMLILYLINWLSCIGNLAAYAWGEHQPAALAVGIFCGMVALATQPERYA